MVLIQNGNITFKSKRILSNLNLSLFPGELCVLIGENGIGKTSFVNAISANAKYRIVSKGYCYGVNWGSYDDYEAIRIGIFIGFQHPVELPGAIYIHFLRLISKRIGSGIHLSHKLTKLVSLFKINCNLIYRPINVGFSGGEKRLFELIQMIILEPRFCILDEPDSNLDINKILLISKLILGFCVSDRTILVITHSLNLLNFISPDSVYHLLSDRILSFRKKVFI